MSKIDLRSAIITIGHDKRKDIYDAIVAGGISHECTGKWKQVLMEQHDKATGKTKKVLKALATVERHKIERILHGLEQSVRNHKTEGNWQ
jgi:hypothetical protein